MAFFGNRTHVQHNKPHPLLSVILLGDGHGALSHARAETVFAGADAYRAALSANGSFLLFVPHDGVLAEDALEAFCDAAETADFVFADDDTLLHDGTRTDPRLKPGFAPQTLLSVPYIGFPFLVAASLFRCAAKESMFFDPELTELSLVCALSAKSVRHIPRVLLSRKSRLPVQDGAPVASALMRLGVPALVSDGLFPGSFRVRYPYRENARVSILVRNRYPMPVLRRTLETLETGSVFDAYDLLIVNTADGDPVLDRYLHRLTKNRAARVLQLPKDFPPPSAWNRAAREADSPYLLFLDAAFSPQGCDDIESLLEMCQTDAVGAVGGMLTGVCGELLSCGMTVGLHGGIASLYRGAENTRDRMRDRFVRAVRSVSALPVCGMLTKRETFLAVDGFDETLPVGYDAAYGMRLMSEQKRCVYTPYAVFRQHAALPKPVAISKENDARLTDVFRDMLKKGDPYFHPRWDYGSDGIRMADPPRPALALHEKGVWFP